MQQKKRPQILGELGAAKGLLWAGVMTRFRPQLDCARPVEQSKRGEHRSRPRARARGNVWGSVLMLKHQRNTRRSAMRNLAFHAGDIRFDGRDRHSGGGPKLSVVCRLRRVRQPELWVHNLSTVLGCLERERRLLQCQYAIRSPSRARDTSTQTLVTDNGVGDLVSRPTPNVSAGLLVVAALFAMAALSMLILVAITDVSHFASGMSP